VQIDHIKPTLIAHGTKRLKLTYHKLLPTVAFNFNLRRYTGAAAEHRIEHLTSQLSALTASSDTAGEASSKREVGWCRLTPSNPS
jgi:hypothetical protein